jgi:hypothetical protein
MFWLCVGDLRLTSKKQPPTVPLELILNEFLFAWGKIIWFALCYLKNSCFFIDHKSIICQCVVVLILKAVYCDADFRSICKRVMIVFYSADFILTGLKSILVCFISFWKQLIFLGHESIIFQCIIALNLNTFVFLLIWLDWIQKKGSQKIFNDWIKIHSQYSPVSVPRQGKFLTTGAAPCMVRSGVWWFYLVLCGDVMIYDMKW